MSTSLIIPPFSPAWKRVEEHYGGYFRFGRQAIEEAWHCGDALIAAKAETKHGEWLPALSAVGITPDTAERLRRLRRKYSEIPQLAVFDSVHAALTSGKSPRAVESDGPTIRDPGPLVEVAKIHFDDKGLFEEASLGFAVWMWKDGTDLWAAAAYALRAYGVALAELSIESNEEDCRAVDDLHQAALTMASRFNAEAVRRKGSPPPMLRHAGPLKHRLGGIL